MALYKFKNSNYRFYQQNQTIHTKNNPQPLIITMKYVNYKPKSINTTIKAAGHSQSPDNKNSNIAKPTNSPIYQIERFLVSHKNKDNQKYNRNINTDKKQCRLKKQETKRKILTSNQPYYQNWAEDERNYKNRIKQLQEQIQKYEEYMKQCKQLTLKNKKLQEQMVIILQQLQNRCENQNYFQQAQLNFEQHKQNNNMRMHTRQASLDHKTNSKYYSPHLQQNQITQLYQYIEHLEQTINQVVILSHKFQQNLRKSTKKDLNDMEQRLMNYIFCLQQKTSSVTFRAPDIIKRNQTATLQQEYSQLQYSKFSDPAKSKIHIEGQEYNILRQQADGKQSSNIHIQISSETQKQQSQLKTKKKQQRSHQISRTPKLSINRCQKCAQYVKTIQRNAQKQHILQQKISRMKQITQNMQNQKVKNSTTINKSLGQKQGNFQYKRISDKNSLKSIKQQQQQFKQQKYNILKNTHLTNNKINNSHKVAAQCSNIYQSNINILVQSSVQSSFHHIQNSKKQPIQYSNQQLKRSNNQQKIQNYLKVQKLKQALINIMQQLQQIIHQCQDHPKNPFLTQLTGKLYEQTQYINQLQQEITRLRLEIEKNIQDKQRLEKFIKIQVKQQEQMHSHYFKPLRQPIDCVDHRGTKNKIQEIIKSIRSFEEDFGHKKDMNNTN